MRIYAERKKAAAAAALAPPPPPTKADEVNGLSGKDCLE
jgi:hypothetical protein